MSLVALGLVLGHIAMFGGAREADEGAAAHLWQLLMAGQIPVIAFFAIKWLPRTPGVGQRMEDILKDRPPALGPPWAPWRTGR